MYLELSPLAPELVIALLQNDHADIVQNPLIVSLILNAVGVIPFLLKYIFDYFTEISKEKEERFSFDGFHTKIMLSFLGKTTQFVLGGYNPVFLETLCYASLLDYGLIINDNELLQKARHAGLLLGKEVDGFYKPHLLVPVIIQICEKIYKSKAGEILPLQLIANNFSCRTFNGLIDLVENSANFFEKQIGTTIIIRAVGWRFLMPKMVIQFGTIYPGVYLGPDIELISRKEIIDSKLQKIDNHLSPEQMVNH